MKSVTFRQILLETALVIFSGCHFKHPVFIFQAKVNKPYLSIALYPFTNTCVRVYDIKFLKFYQSLFNSPTDALYICLVVH
jgi:hypothetical protein